MQSFVLYQRSCGAADYCTENAGALLHFGESFSFNHWSNLTSVTVGYMSEAFQSPSHPYFVPFSKKKTPLVSFLHFHLKLFRARVEMNTRRPERSRKYSTFIKLTSERGKL